MCCARFNSTHLRDTASQTGVWAWKEASAMFIKRKQPRLMFFFFVLIVLGGHPLLQRPLALHLEEAKRSEVARVLHGGPSSPQNSFLAPPKEEDHVTASQRRRWPQKQVWQHSQDLFLIKIH